MKRARNGIWREDGKALTATIGDSIYRIVKYPDDSQMSGKFGVYQDGRFQAAVPSLATAKTRCAGLAAKNRNGFFSFRREPP